MKRARKSGFTLVEMMVVTIIIAILLMLVLPAINAVRRAAQRSKATAQVTQIANAIKQYQVVYSKLPGQTGMGNDPVYMGSDQRTVLDPLMDNPRDKIFIEIPPDSLYGGLFCDPWGTNANNAYIIILDEDGDGVININLSHYNPPITAVVTARVAVCSFGYKPGSADHVKDRIVSWIH